MARKRAKPHRPHPAKPVTALLALSACLLPSAASASPAPLVRVHEAIERAGRRYVSDRCHVGLSIAAVVRGQSVFYNFGSVRRTPRQRPTPDSVYELASVTKTFTGALAAGALLDGRMTLDRDFRAYLPGRYPNLSKSGHPITLRTLATHSSGLQRDLPDSYHLLARPDHDRIGDQLRALNRGFDRARSLAALHRIALRTTPGARFAYSNIGIRLIGYGLEEVYRTPLPHLLRRAILDPLGMVDTGFTLSSAMRARSVTPYNRNGRVQPHHDDSAGAAYGLYSTPRDMARYLAWHLDGRDRVIARAHRPLRGTRADGEALIWNLGHDRGTPILWHGGGTFGQTSQMVLFPQDRIGLALLANDTCAGSETELKAIALDAHAALRGDK